MKYAFWLFFLVGCGGPAFEPLSFSSESGRYPSDDSPAMPERLPFDGGVNEGARTSEENEGGSDSPNPSGDGGDVTSEPPSLRDALSDPWPDGVDVRPVNCFRSFTGDLVCCYGMAPGSTCEGHEGQTFCEGCIR